MGKIKLINAKELSYCPVYVNIGHSQIETKLSPNIVQFTMKINEISILSYCFFDQNFELEIFSQVK